MALQIKNKPRYGGKKSVSYWGKRGTTLRYLFLFLIGILLGSIYSAAAGTDSIAFRILQNQMESIPESSLWQLLQNRFLFVAIMVLYLIIAGSCLWGRYMVPAVPILFGLAQGAEITFLLLGLGWNALRYLLLCVVLPKSMMLVLLILLCNISRSRCIRMVENPSDRGSSALGLPQILLASLLLLLCLLEQFLQMKCVSWIL